MMQKAPFIGAVSLEFTYKKRYLDFILTLNRGPLHSRTLGYFQQ